MIVWTAPPNFQFLFYVHIQQQQQQQHINPKKFFFAHQNELELDFEPKKNGKRRKMCFFHNQILLRISNSFRSMNIIILINGFCHVML